MNYFGRTKKTFGLFDLAAAVEALVPPSFESALAWKISRASVHDVIGAGPPFPEGLVPT